MRAPHALFLATLGGFVLLACDQAPTMEPTTQRTDQDRTLCPAGGACDGPLVMKAFDMGATSALATDWVIGDVFAGVAGGQYDVFDNAGVFKETIVDGLGGFTTGCSFNAALDRLYTTNFSSSSVVVYDEASPHNIVQTIPTGLAAAESIVFSASGNFFVGSPSSAAIEEYDAAGNLVDSDPVAADGTGGTDWMDLAADQMTMFFTAEGRNVHRYDVVNDVQLANFATLPGAGQAFALRLLPPGDGSGGLLVADLNEVKQLDGTGAVVATFDVTGENSWFSLNLDPDGTSFWAGNFGSGIFYRFDLATPGTDTHIQAVNSSNPGTLFGLCLQGEITVGVPTVEIDIKPNSDPNSINPRSMGLVPVAILGSESFDVTDVDVTTLTFGPGAATPAHDLTNPVTYADHLQDVNLDGFTDLVSHYVQKEAGFVPGDTEGCLSGDKVGGGSFMGCDAVRILGG